MLEQDPKERILQIARALFAEKGYAGTSLADIASHFGASKQAIGYHFKAKLDILLAVTAGPARELADIIKQAKAGHMSTEELLDAVLASVVANGPLIASLGDDPSAAFELKRSIGNAHGFDALVAAVIRLLAGPRPSQAELVRAHAAFAIVKNAPLSRMAETGAALSEGERVEILACALAVMGKRPRRAVGRSQRQRRAGGEGTAPQRQSR